MRTSIAKQTICLFCVIAFGFARVAAASSAIASCKANVPTTNDTVAMTTQQFDEWVRAKVEEPATAASDPHVAENALMKRLRAGRFVNDEAVMSVITNWANYELKQSERLPSKAIRLPNTKRLIDELQPFTYGRPMLAARLYQEKAVDFGLEGDRHDEAQEYNKALQILNPLHVEIDRQRVSSLVNAAGSLYSVGDIKGAEALYREALEYPYYLVTDPEAEQVFKGDYLMAARGLIDCRRNDLAALKETSFALWAQGELQPYLDEAIKDAEQRTKLPSH